jgi:hypothetical protein
MAFDDTVLSEYNELGSGEVLASMPNVIQAFETFEDGLVQGRFCKYDTGSVDNLDGSAIPTLAGVTVRDITQATAANTYDSTRTPAGDDVAMVCNFGYITVDVVSGLDPAPAKYDQVYTVNATGADSGKATNDSGQLEVLGAIFWEEKADNVWVVRVMMGVELTTAYVAALPSLDVSAVDGTDGTAALTVQALDVDGTDYEENVFTRIWVGTADDFGADAITGITATTGTLKEAVTANAEYLVISDATGTIELALDNGGAGTIYAWAEIGGKIYPSGAIVITA